MSKFKKDGETLCYIIDCDKSEEQYLSFNYNRHVRDDFCDSMNNIDGSFMNYIRHTIDDIRFILDNLEKDISIYKDAKNLMIANELNKKEK